MVLILVHPMLKPAKQSKWSNGALVPAALGIVAISVQAISKWNTVYQLSRYNAQLNRSIEENDYYRSLLLVSERNKNIARYYGVNVEALCQNNVKTVYDPLAVEAGVDIPGVEDGTALSLASRNQGCKSVSSLRAVEANVDIPGVEDGTALSLARSNQDCKAVSSSRAVGADVDTQGVEREIVLLGASRSQGCKSVSSSRAVDAKGARSGTASLGASRNQGCKSLNSLFSGGVQGR